MCVCAWFPSDICQHMVLFGYGLWSQMFCAFSFSSGHSIVLCVCDAVVLTGVSWPAPCTPELNHVKLAYRCLFYWLACFLFFSPCVCVYPFPFPSTSSSASTALLLAEERESTEVVRAKENLRDRHLVVSAICSDVNCDAWQCFSIP